MEERALTRIEGGPMTLDEVVGQVTLIQEIMKNVMKEDEHYGTIPGTKKPSLWKPGAEKLCLTFHLEPDYQIITHIGEKNFISYTVKCMLLPMKVTGLGSCNSRETKYRYRSDNTGRPVPKEYWDNRNSSILGGSQYTVRKKDKQWFIFEQVENDNPWDLDNTLLKMACKRSLVAATLNATAASDIFTQDLEDLKGKDEDIIEAEVVEEDRKPPQDNEKPPKSTQGSNKIDCPKYKKEILKAACNACTEKKDCKSWGIPEEKKEPEEESVEDPISKFRNLTPLKFRKLLNKHIEEIPTWPSERQKAIQEEHEKHFSGQPFPIVMPGDKPKADPPLMLHCPMDHDEIPKKNDEGNVPLEWCKTKDNCNPEWQESCKSFQTYMKNIGNKE